MAIIQFRFAAKLVGQHTGGSFIGHDQKTFCWVFKPKQCRHTFSDRLFFLRRQFAKEICQRGASLKTGNTEKHTLVVWRDGHFRKYRIFFQFSQLRFTHAASFNPCETVAIVGESGSGKSVTMKAAVGLLDSNATINSGEILYTYDDGHGQDKTVDLLKLSKKQLRTEYNGQRLAMVFQDPMASLNPRKKVGDIISEGMDIHHRFANWQEREEKISEMLKKVGLSPEHAARYPHQFSGGQRQRVGIARALIMNPKLIIADECISALDVSIQAQVVNLMKDIQEETQCAYLFIAHDLSMVKYISDRIGVLHLGYMVESGTKEEIFSHPIHLYTKSLLSAIPHPNPVVEKHRVALTYNYATSGIDYTKGTEHSVGGTHTVLATDEEFDSWTK